MASFFFLNQKKCIFVFELKKKKDMKKQVLFLFSFVIVLSLFSCKSVTNSSNKPLQNQHWTLVQIENNQVIEAESEPYIEFLTEENRVAGNFGCNQMLGS
jgi:heat shock protein HslJ